MNRGSRGRKATLTEPSVEDHPLQIWAIACGWFVFVTATAVLVGGWVLDLDTLKNLIPGTVVLKGSTAFGMMCGAVSILLLADPAGSSWKHRLGQGLAVICLAIGVLFLAEHLFGWSFGIDEFPFRDNVGRAAGVSHPGRPAPTTAASFILLAIALLAIDRPSRPGRWRASEYMVVPLVSIAAVSLVGYLYSIPSFYGPDAQAKMALVTGICFLVLALALVLARPEGRLVQLATTDLHGSAMARYLIPLFFFVQLSLGWARLRATDAGVFGDRVGNWWFTAASIIVFVLIIGRLASRMNADDSYRRELEAELQVLASRDELTGLFNRRRFLDELRAHSRRTARRGGNSALIVLDLDDLKAVNDEFGHMTGDALLAKVGRAIKQSVRVTDVAARQGGDEFAVLLVDSTREGARQVAEKIRLAIDAIRVEASLGATGSSASIGVAHAWGRLDDDGFRLLASADEAMYAAKRAGGNRLEVSEGRGDDPLVPASYPAPADDGRRIENWSTGFSPDRHVQRSADAVRSSPSLVGSSAFAISALVILGIVFLSSLLAEHSSPTVIAIAAACLLLATYLLRIHFREAGRAQQNFLTSASLEAALDCVVTIDAHSKVVAWNQSAVETFGFTRDEAIGNNMADLIIPPDLREDHLAGMKRVLDGGDSNVVGQRLEFDALDTFGHSVPIEMTVARIQRVPPLYTAFIRNMTERRNQEQENNRLAEIVRSSHDAIFTKDLDGIVTSWNQGAERIYGYSPEEAIGKRLIDLTIPLDRLDEMTEITRKVISGEPVALETRRNHKSGEPVDVSLRAFPIRSLSGEVTSIAIGAHDISERLLREARESLDAEGKLWRGRVANAIRDDKFVFWAQPVVNAATGTINHHELLIRMNLDGRIVTPFEFLPHAENSNLIVEIDRWAIQRGVRIAREHPVAINLSGKSLSTTGLIDMIRGSLAASGTPAGNVRFEITETAAVENLDAARLLVDNLGGLGCRTALDDFGTGYGSFTYLKHLAVSELKIDMTFIRDLTTSEPDQRVVKSILAVARNFDMETVAEGVEDEDTLKMLTTMGVDLLQGYHLGRPQPDSFVTPPVT